MIAEKKMELTLYIGNKNYSSWSLRPYLALKQTGLPFSEVLIPLRQADTKARLNAISPGGTVPVLHHGDLILWDSLAICEYLAELAPAAQLWPQDRAQRAKARSIAAQMHCGFSTLRENLPMDLTTDRRHQSRAKAAHDDIVLISRLWSQCLQESGGPFLFGHFTITDAMYAPVATRFRTYDVSLEQPLQDYIRAIYALPAFREWQEAAKTEERDFHFPVLEKALP